MLLRAADTNLFVLLCTFLLMSGMNMSRTSVPVRKAEVKVTEALFSASRTQLNFTSACEVLDAAFLDIGYKGILVAVRETFVTYLTKHLPKETRPLKHDMIHLIGAWMMMHGHLNSTSNIMHVLSRHAMDAYFEHGAPMHAAVWQAVAHLQVSSPGARWEFIQRQLCNSSVIGFGALVYTNCFHGVGHGMLKVSTAQIHGTNYSVCGPAQAFRLTKETLSVAVYWCRLASGEVVAGACVSGAVHGYLEHDSEAISPLSACVYAEPFVSVLCFEQYALHDMALNFRPSAIWCKSLPACYVAFAVRQRILLPMQFEHTSPGVYCRELLAEEKFSWWLACVALYAMAGWRFSFLLPANYADDCTSSICTDMLLDVPLHFNDSLHEKAVAICTESCEEMSASRFEQLMGVLHGAV